MINTDIKTYWDINSISNIKKLDEAAKAFETEFIHIFLKEVRKSMEKGMFNSSFTSKMYLDMFDMQMAKSISDSDKLGIKEYFLEAIKAYEKNMK
ncbi:rod-binding protein [Nitrosophilus kaiyonis]|uniref:rod-binding protein n=1 Tax=Nitrosophilus kaiyonis TaxID=2930200 RepID=UPI00248F84D7|nr:rod-binding protein [Nitrosophilus kaiyonis]